MWGTDRGEELVSWLEREIVQREGSFPDRLTSKNINETLAVISNNPPKKLTLPDLDKYEYRRELCDSIRSIDAASTAKISPELVWWTYNNTHIEDWAQNYLFRAHRAVRFETNTADKSRLFIWRNDLTKMRSDSLLSLRGYETISLIRGLTDESLEKICVRAQERAFPNAGGFFSLSAFETHREMGWVTSLRMKEVKRGEFLGIYLDTPIGILLKRPSPDNYIAMVSLFPFDPQTLGIHQWQGVNRFYIEGIGKNEKKVNIPNHSLDGKDWRCYFTMVAAQLANILGFEKVGVIGGTNSRWIKPEGKEPAHLTLEQAQKSYDKHALELGFRPRPDGNFELETEHILERIKPRYTRMPRKETLDALF